MKPSTKNYRNRRKKLLRMKHKYLIKENSDDTESTNLSDPIAACTSHDKPLTTQTEKAHRYSNSGNLRRCRRPSRHRRVDCAPGPGGGPLRERGNQIGHKRVECAPPTGGGPLTGTGGPNYSGVRDKQTTFTLTSL